MPKAKGELGPLERAVMDRIWKREHPLSVRDIHEELAGTRQLAYTTVMTVMERLSRKGLLTRRRAGRAYVYQAACTREEHTAAIVSQVLKRAGDRRSVLLGFVRAVHDTDLAELRRAIEEVERERGLRGRR